MQNYQSISRKTGDIGERAAADFLVRNGYKILDRNYTVRGGEIDIIAQKYETIAFVEVKTRKEAPLSEGEEAITPVKKKRLIATAERYFNEVINDIPELQQYFDIKISA